MIAAFFLFHNYYLLLFDNFLLTNEFNFAIIRVTKRRDH